MAAEFGDTSFDDLLDEFLYGPPFVPEDILIPQDTLESILSSTSLDLAYLHRLLGGSSDTRSGQEITPSSFLPHDVSAPSSFSPQIAAATLCPRNWRKIPQEVYGYGEKQWDFRASETIFFHINGHPGVNMGDALRKKFTGLDGRDDLVLQDARGAISCRLSFPGYLRNSSPQISTKRWNKTRDPISRSHLAYQVARKLKQYLDSMANSNIDESAHEQWTIGEGFMQLDNMFLVRFENVAKGSYQPEIWVVDRTLTA